MSLIANGAGEQPTGFYKGVATQSLRFEDGSSTYLTKTFGSDGTGSGATCTISCWVKRANISNNDQWFFTAGASSPAWLLGFRTADTLVFGDDDGNPKVTVTDRVFRDTSAWYHIVLTVKTSESDNANKYKIYVNGELQATTFSGTAADTLFGANVVHNIGRYPTGSTYVDLYMSELNFVDGLALDASYFGETKNGVWIPKEPDVSEYGTNGFRFKFDQVGVGTASTSTIGADSSGKTNHFTSSGIVASDCAMPDSPENNFCTTNGVMRANITKSEGNLKMVGVGGNYDNLGATFAVDVEDSEGWYWEYRSIGNDASTVVGFADPQNAQFNQSDPSGSFTNEGDGKGYMGDGNKRNNNSSASYGNSWTGGDIIGIAVKSGAVYFYKNGTIQASGAAAYSSITGLITPAFGINGTHSGTANFGQDSSFAGTETAQGNTDANGFGDFYYTVPSGYKALCSANMAEPTISPNALTQADDHFNTVLYTGTGSSNAINTVGFQTDWLWIKRRNGATSHRLIDSSRGVDKYFSSDTTNAEDDATGIFTSFDSGGFTVEGTANSTNGSSQTYVAWNWKANGGTTTTNDASSTGVGSQDSVYQANTTSGFSIVLYTGTGSNNTFAHGLGVAPKWIIHKKRNGAQHWVHYHVGIGNTRSVLFNTDAQNSASAVNFNNTSPTSTVFSLGTDAYANASGDTYVAYCFAEVEGFSRFGTYTGNSNADGPFIYTGFRPAWIMVKLTSGSGENWHMFDNKRATQNVIKARLIADGSSAENSNDSILDFTSNGFKFRENNAGWNGNGNTYIYMAFAEAPFKYANAR